MRVEEKAELCCIEEKLKLLVNELLFVASDMQFQSDDKMEQIWADHLHETALKYKKSIHELNKIK